MTPWLHARNSQRRPSDQQILFLLRLQRLLDEGLFVASYKFVLLANGVIAATT
jgi:hypothetical protein